jgi:hypothetical protein
MAEMCHQMDSMTSRVAHAASILTAHFADKPLLPPV